MLDILNIKKENSIIKQAIEREFMKENSTYKTVNCNVEEFKILDFAMPELVLSSQIHKNKCEQKRYFNKYQARPTIDDKKCKGCSICSRVCPTKAITMKLDKNGELYAEIDYKKCIFCNKCLTACPYSVTKLCVPAKHLEMDREISKFNK